MKPISVLINLGSPIELPKNPIHLDALLYAAIEELGGDVAMLDDILAKSDNIYHASAMQYIRSVVAPICAVSVAHPTVTKWADFTGDIKKKSISEKGGPFRKRMTKRNGILVGQVMFNAVGDADKITWLLNSLGFIGLSNRQGYGEIRSVQIAEDQQDFSWFDDTGALARVLPVTLMPNGDQGNYLVRDNSFAPCYKYSETAKCCIPNFRQKTII